MTPLFSLWLLASILCTVAAATATTQRFAITYEEGTDSADVLAQLEGAGYAVIKHLHSINTFADMMWVASAGVDDGPPPPWEPTFTPLYPASYAEVISVATVDCNGTQADWSVANPNVELAAPGVDIVSDLPIGFYAQVATLDISGTSNAGVAYPAPQAMGGVDDSLPGNASVSGRLVYCGLAITTCLGAQGAVCLILRGEIFYSQKIAACMAGGGVGAVIYNRADVGGCEQVDPAYFNNGDNILDMAITGDQGVALKARLDANETVTASLTITIQSDLLVSFSDGSLAAPHVSAAAARVWALCPKCTVADARRPARQRPPQGEGGSRHAQLRVRLRHRADG